MTDSITDLLSRGGSLVQRLWKPKFDPRRPQRVYREFDEQRGFAAYNEYCRRLYPGTAPGKPGPLVEAGFEYVDVMPPESARRLLDSISEHAPLTYVKKNTYNLEGFRIQDRGAIESMLADALPAAVTVPAEAYFASHFLVHWFTVSRTAPAQQQKSVSFKWHCDKGPRHHLKLLVYLNATAEHGGNTAFLPQEQSALIASMGYLFGPTRSRDRDLGELSRRAGRSLQESCRELSAGQGVLFQPAVVLHSGVSPSRASRYVLTLCLLPSPVPWRDALRRGAIVDLADDEKWPAHANELLEALGLPERV
jgi:hypothetical protein